MERNEKNWWQTCIQIAYKRIYKLEHEANGMHDHDQRDVIIKYAVKLETMEEEKYRNRTTTQVK